MQSIVAMEVWLEATEAELEYGYIVAADSRQRPVVEVGPGCNS